MTDLDRATVEEWRQWAVDYADGALGTKRLRVLADALLKAWDELERVRRGAQTLGHVVEQNGRMILDITGLHDWIGDDGDGDWGAVWENAYELLPRAEKAERERDVHAEAAKRYRDNWEQSNAIASNLERELADLRAKVAELADDFQERVDWSNGRSNYGDNAAYEECARDLRELADPQTTEETR